MAAAAKRVNWFPILISGLVLVVVAVIVIIVSLMNNRATAPAVAPDSVVVNEDTGAIALGDGDTTIDTYVDFICPVCGDFEDTYGASLQAAANNGDITLNIHPVGLLDSYSQGTEFSSRSANAMYCVAAEAPDSVLEFFNLMFENQPAESSTGLTDEEITGYAEQAGASAASSCIADGEYRDFVEQETEAMPLQPDATRQATPTIAINGEVIGNSDIATELAAVLPAD